MKKFFKFSGTFIVIVTLLTACQNSPSRGDTISIDSYQSEKATTESRVSVTVSDPAASTAITTSQPSTAPTKTIPQL